MWDISGPILALHFPYLPFSAGETSILISAECQKELVGEWEGETESGWKEGVHLIRQLRIREEDLGERGPNVLERGTSSLSNYHWAVFSRADSVSTYGGRPGTTACSRFTSTRILMHKLMQIWLRFKCTSNDAQKRYKSTHKRAHTQTHRHTHTAGRGLSAITAQWNIFRLERCRITLQPDDKYAVSTIINLAPLPIFRLQTWWCKKKGGLEHAGWSSCLGGGCSRAAGACSEQRHCLVRWALTGTRGHDILTHQARL